MPYDYVVDRERKFLWVRYSGAVSVAERRAAAERVLDEVDGPEARRILVDYRSATSRAVDEAAGSALGDYLAARLGNHGVRVAWLVKYDHQLDDVVEAKTREHGVDNRRFRDLDEAVAWLQQSATAAAAVRTSAVAHGTFQVTVAPQSPDNPPAQAAGLVRLSLDKRYSGPLEAVGQGEMLADGGGGKKDGAYVAMERVTGTLHDRAGSFALVHRALLRDGTPEGWSVVVVPGSGTGALVGLEGSLRVTVEHGTHFYDLEYSLPG